MRVTNSMLVNTFKRNLTNNLREMDRVQEHLSSGKRINRPSDDPVGITFSLRFRSNLTETEQYQKNVSDALSWMETTDMALGQVGDVLQRARELTIYGASDALPQASRDAIAKEISQLKEQLIQIGNTNLGGRFIFGGLKTAQPPFDSSGNYLGSNSPAEMRYEFGPGVTVPINIAGDVVFKSPQDIFATLDAIAADLNAGNTANLSGARLGELDTVLENVLNWRAEMGAKINRVELAKNRLEQTELNFKDLLSKTDDADMAQVITELKTKEEVYRSSLAAGARIMQPTLLDFLR